MSSSESELSVSSIILSESVVARMSPLSGLYGLRPGVNSVLVLVRFPAVVVVTTVGSSSLDSDEEISMKSTAGMTTSNSTEYGEYGSKIGMTGYCDDYLSRSPVSNYAKQKY
jgi:hypothetical protein